MVANDSHSFTSGLASMRLFRFVGSGIPQAFALFTFLLAPKAAALEPPPPSLRAVAIEYESLCRTKYADDLDGLLKHFSMLEIEFPGYVPITAATTALDVRITGDNKPLEGFFSKLSVVFRTEPKFINPIVAIAIERSLHEIEQEKKKNLYQMEKPIQ